ncbi:glycerol-3-phosphate dehydrogenase [Chloropicon primus]|uniref:Glycerol-3-phosphate dehydrogenase [NAD(+)] n=2 Tax=Chloropicon primus TaxID=1764295 RepID=A0A5B8MHG5_9CHLO|nr:glycerol-3-phosphate dehydrogenase [Chloropicon primus]UPQ99127.1 glycerol-3-phosphate dehydrogenase [Chloropicon primus]|eukprot:QDZ19916.1 glycerol-3-phosphate dehydrogenase [Chloropicon primus]
MKRMKSSSSMTNLLGAHQESAEMKVTVFGSGSFGMAMATLVARNGFDVVVLTRREEVAEGINKDRRNPTHLKEFLLPENLKATTDAVEALRGTSFIVHCIPLQSTKSFLESMKDKIEPGVPIVSTSKGLHTETLEMMHEIIPNALGRPQPVAFLSGPTFAQDIMANTPSGAVLASEDIMMSRKLAHLFSGPTMRVYPSEDVIGVQVGGALKNVIAILAGVAEGLGLGINAVALLVTRGCREMNRLAVAMGGQEHTMNGLAGIGDLMLTCLGGLSRNKRVGIELGRGKNLEQVLKERAESLQGVAEGVATTPAAVKLATRYRIPTPIMFMANRLLKGEDDAANLLKDMMEAPMLDDVSLEMEFQAMKYW